MNSEIKMESTGARSQLTLAILAGGSGKRLGGAAKGLLTFQGISYVERILQLSALCSEGLIISSDPRYDAFDARRVEDVEPGRGAPGGVVSALLAARAPWVLVVACDMPFVTVQAARLLIAAAGNHDVVCFQRGGMLEPLLGVYRASLGPLWRERLGENPSMKLLLSGASVCALQPADPGCLESINTPEQLAAVKS